MGEKAAETARNLKPGEVMLLENLRFYAEEEGKPRGLAEDASEEEKAAAKKAVKASQKEFVERLALVSRLLHQRRFRHRSPRTRFHRRHR